MKDKERANRIWDFVYAQAIVEIASNKYGFYIDDDGASCAISLADDARKYFLEDTLGMTYENWDRFLSNPEIDKKAAVAAKQLIALLRPYDVPLPRAGIVDGELQVVWDIDGHHIDVVVHDSDNIDWFYSNEAKSDHDGDEASLRDAIESLIPILRKMYV